VTVREIAGDREIVKRVVRQVSRNERERMSAEIKPRADTQRETCERDPN
jgi:hypothetical protein